MHWAAASDLALDYGWPRGWVQIESSGGWDLDLVAFDRDRRGADAIALLAGEAKARPRVLRHLIRDMTACGGSRPEVHYDHPKQTEHNKCLGLLRLLSSRDRVYYWGVAPDLRVGAIATRAEGGFALEPVTIQPQREDVLNLVET